MSEYDSIFSFKIPGFLEIPGMSLFLFLSIVIFFSFLIWLAAYYCRIPLKHGEVAVVERFFKIFRFFRMNTVWVFPLIDNVSIISSEPTGFEIEIEDVVSYEGFKFTLLFEITATIDTTPDAIMKNAEKFGSMQKIAYYIEDTLKPLCSMALLDSSSNIYKIANDPNPIFANSEAKLREELFKHDIILGKFKMISAKDDKGVIERLKAVSAAAKG